MKYLLIVGISLMMLSCSSTNQSSYFGYNNNPKIEDNSNDEIEVYKTGNNTEYSVNNDDSELERTRYITNYYVLPPGYYNPWDYPQYDYYRSGYPDFYFYWDNWRYSRWSYYSPYSYWGYNPWYSHHHHYYDYHYYDNNYGGNYTPAPKKQNYRDFGVSRGDFGSPSRNVTSSSGSRNSNTEPVGSVRNVNSSNTRVNSSDYYNKPNSSNVENPSRNESDTSPQKGSSQRNGSDVEIKQSAPRNETPSRSNDRVAPSNSGSSSSPSKSSGSSSPSRSTEKSSENSGQKRR